MAHDCSSIRDDLVAFLDGALEPTRAAAVTAHLAGCAACEAERRALASAWSALDLLPGAEVRPGFLAELEARLLPAGPKLEQRAQPALRALEGGKRPANRAVQRWLALAAAALLAAGLGALVVTRLRPAQTGEDVAVQPERPAPDAPRRSPGATERAPRTEPPPPQTTEPRRPDAPVVPAVDPLRDLPAEERELVLNLELLRDLDQAEELGLLEAAELFDDMDAEEFDEG